MTEMVKREKIKKTIIFDFDGTIADSIPVMIQIFNKHLAQKYHLDKIKDTKSLREMDLRGLMRMTHLPFYRMIFFIRNAKREFEKYVGKIKPYAGIEPALKALSKNHKLGILSSNSVENIERFLKKNGLSKYFSFVYSERSLFGKHKALKKIMRKHNLRERDVVYVGDEVRDAVAARKAKVKMISVTWGHNSEKRLRTEKPDFIAKRRADLVQITKRI